MKYLIILLLSTQAMAITAHEAIQITNKARVDLAPIWAKERKEEERKEKRQRLKRISKIDNGILKEAKRGNYIFTAEWYPCSLLQNLGYEERGFHLQGRARYELKKSSYVSGYDCDVYWDKP